MLNELQIIGALGRDAEVRKANDFFVIQFSVATSESWKDKEGKKQERVTWVDCTRWMKKEESANNYAKFLTKGSKIYASGLATARAYKNENTGEAVAVLCLRVDKINIIHSTKEREQSANTPPPPGDYAGYSEDDDDLPF